MQDRGQGQHGHKGNSDEAGERGIFGNRLTVGARPDDDWDLMLRGRAMAAAGTEVNQWSW